MSRITSEKLSQAAGLVAQSGADAWLTFVRETAEGADPVLPFLIDGGLTWQSALIVSKDGKKIAIVGNYDADPLKASGDWDQVIPYVQGIKEPLADTLRELGASTVAVNYSVDDVKADGLSHGMYLLLQEYLPELTLVSAQPIVTAMRSRKTPKEVAAMREAIGETEILFGDIESYARVGRSEREVFDFVQSTIRERGLGFAWDSAGDPIVNSGPDSMVGHGIPSVEIKIEPGHIFHVDLGVVKSGYSSDLQRCWLVGSQIPEDVSHAFAAVIGALDAGAAELRVGVEGWQVDAAARSFLLAQGYPEYMHAFGHQVGRVAHDGGGILGPQWERYGRTPTMPIEANQVYTVELGVDVPGRGYLGIEEMVLVTPRGLDWLSTRQLEMWMIS